ncbi:hypothetical protein Tco_0429605 [Tanacetum coccineum]
MVFSGHQKLFRRGRLPPPHCHPHYSLSTVVPITSAPSHQLTPFSDSSPIAAATMHPPPSPPWLFPQPTPSLCLHTTRPSTPLQVILATPLAAPPFSPNSTRHHCHAPPPSSLLRPAGAFGFVFKTAKQGRLDLHLTTLTGVFGLGHPIRGRLFCCSAAPKVAFGIAVFAIAWTGWNEISKDMDW